MVYNEVLCIFFIHTNFFCLIDNMYDQHIFPVENVAQMVLSLQRFSIKLKAKFLQPKLTKKPLVFDFCNNKNFD